MTGRSDQSEQLIIYPTDWTYTIIGENENQIRSAIAEVIQWEIKDICFSRMSSGGKYCSLHVTVQVQSEKMRDEIHKALADHRHIRFVL